jgi:acyl-phosphate glycerol 3-phosphate acyltransferase
MSTEQPVTLATGTIIFLILGYLSGSVSYAIVVTRIAIGQDIRTLGNRNPGTANVSRNIGKGWAAVVGVLDALKGMVPVLLARLTFFGGDTPLEWFLLYLIGIAAVVGHVWPVFYGFRGGGGLGTMQGVSLVFVPVEYIFSALVGTAVVVTFLKKVKYPFGRWVPIFFTLLTPFVTLATTLLLDVHLFAHISIGGHNWGIVAGSFTMSLTILALNVPKLKESTDDLAQSRRDPTGAPE